MTREKFGQLILIKIIETVATRCQILRLKCTKFDFGSSPDPVGELTALPRPRLYLRGLLVGERTEERGWEVPPALLIPPRCSGC